MNEIDVAIVGAGPIGLELAVALKQAGVSYAQFEAGQVGQTIRWFPYQSRFFSSPERIALADVPLNTVDQTKATREEYLTYLRGIVQQFDLDVLSHTRITRIAPLPEGGFELLAQRVAPALGGPGEEMAAPARPMDEAPVLWRARRVVLITGDMARPRRLNIPGEELPHVSHYFREPHDHFRRRLLILGGKNSAVEAAIRCHRAGAEVTISHRREAFNPKSVKYWLLPEIEGFIRNGHIRYLPLTVSEEITAQDVALRHTPDGSQLRVPADDVLLLVGYEADVSLFRMAGVTLEGENGGPRHDPRTMETEVPGLYVAGTAAAGTQVSFRLFIENCHVHVDRIVEALTGHAATPRSRRNFSLPES